MITPEFKKAVERLNPEQRAAVESIEGPVMVVAGPGTGKTEVLTLRIANILLQTDTKPENILALTFTEAAASNMRKRLANIIGSPAYRVRIQTFHSFCNDILQGYPEYFPRIVGSSSITEVEATAIVEEIIKEDGFSILRPWGDPLLYIGNILKKIEELKREGLDPEAFKNLIRKSSEKLRKDTKLKKAEQIKQERVLEKNQELALAYERYQEKLFEKRLYDYSDMIMEVLKALEDKKLKDLKLTLQEEFQYILVDEHQDTNNAQNRILEILADFHQNPNIFVVGDHKQAIFRFQGASVENFLHFKKLYPKALLIDLFRNYRSHQNILDSAHSLIPSEKPLQAQVSKSPFDTIKIAVFKNQTLENCWIAEQIKKIENKEETVAIIYRSNKEAFALAHQLGKCEVPYIIESDEDLLGDRFVRKLVDLLYAINYYGDDAYIGAALHIEELGLDPLEAYKIIRFAYKSRKSVYDVLPEGLAEKFKNWIKKSKEEDLVNFIESIFRESGLFESALKSRDAEAFTGVERILDEARKIAERKNGGNLSDFINYLNVLKTHGLFIKRPKTSAAAGAVRLMTAHKSKGLEFDTVFITNASERSFGRKSNRDLLPLINLSKSPFDSEGLDDERRLFYVALTRAKKNIFITRHECDVEGKELLPTQFIAEIKSELKEEIDVSKFEVENRSSLGKKPGKKIREIDQKFVEELFYSEQFSVTALNNYLSCPWKYFYRNLVRIPTVQQKYLLYGTAMHAAVESFLKTRLVREVNKEFLLQEFEKNMTELPFDRHDSEEALLKGKESLSAWFDDRASTWGTAYKIEQPLYGVEFEGLRLSGKLDKIDFLDTYEVAVTDYKTGKPKSRNDIEGKTKDSTGDYKRQLVFYKLLLNLHDDGRLNMTRGIIEFLEPNESGKIKYEEFEIGDSEVEELKETIRRVEKEITSLSFWDKTCDDRDCEYCAYRKLLG